MAIVKKQGKKSASKPKTRKKNTGIITKDILMGELVSQYPQTNQVLMKHGLHCIGCMLSPYESLESGVAVHGIPLAPLLKELNAVVKAGK